MTETQRLRARLDTIAADLMLEFPKQKVARALIATACDISIPEIGPMGTVWMTEHATGLLAGHWSPEAIGIFIDTNRA